MWLSDSVKIGLLLLLLFELWFTIVDGYCDGVDGGFDATLAKCESRMMPFDATNVACCQSCFGLK